MPGLFPRLPRPPPMLRGAGPVSTSLPLLWGIVHLVVGLRGLASGLNMVEALVAPRPERLLIGAGARYLPLLEAEPWRLLTAALLHVDLGHLASNVLGGLVLGAWGERRHGSVPWLLVFWGGALGGSLLSTWAGVVLSCGASGGLLAWLAVAAVEAAPDERGAYRAALLIVFLSSAVLPGVALTAHAGGALVGLAVGLGLRARPRHPHPPPSG